jgi:exonuclease SbcC
MKVINLKKLIITNFKGIHHLEISFDQCTNIHGDNATGKTTIFDAFTWLLFGKDSSDRKDFEIKRLGRDGKPIEKTECEVSADVTINDKPVSLKRIFREKWVKKRGALNAEFTGNEQAFFYNDVPLQAGEYQDKIGAILDESIFKLITNTLYFNSLNWKDRRKVLMEMAGDISCESLAAEQKRFSPLVEILNNKSLEEYRSEIFAKKKKLKGELELIPTRIDELNRSMPEVLHWTGLKSDIAFIQAELNSIDEAIADRSKKYEQEFKKIEEHQRQVHQLMIKKDALYYEIKGAYDRRVQEEGKSLRLKSAEMDQLQRSRQQLINQTSSLSTSIADCTRLVADKRADWHKVNSQTIQFDDHAFACPACKRKLEEGDIEEKKSEMERNFISSKTLRLNSIQQEGKRAADKLQGLTDQLQESNRQIEQIDTQVQALSEEISRLQQIEKQPLDSFADIISRDAEYQDLVSKVADLNASKPEIRQPDNSEDLFKKKDLNVNLDTLKKKLATKDQIDRAHARIQELEEQQRTFSQQLADLEKSEFLLAEFGKAKMEMVEERINGKFKYVSFKMYNTLINGGEEDACESMVDGVPFSNLNTAGKINAGIDIINALCDHYQVYAPIFIDNRESINKLLDSKSQLVNLVVTKDKKLVVVSSSPEMAMAS